MFGTPRTPFVLSLFLAIAVLWLRIASRRWGADAHLDIDANLRD
jgi:hypothetical protein